MKIKYRLIIYKNKMSINSIVINGSSCVDSINNAKYKYSFNTSKYFKRTDQVALNLCNIFYSWKNISATNYNNNTFQYQWFSSVNNTSMETFTVTLPDSYMTVSDINEYLVAYMTTRYHYTQKTNTDGSKSNVYYITLSENSNYYSVQLDLTVMSSTATVPNGGTWLPPSTNKTPVFIVNSTNNFGSLIGFSSGSYPSTTKTANYTKLSNLVPNMNPVSSILMTCNLIKNDYSTPNNVLHSFTSFNSTYGGMIEITPNEKTFINIIEGTYKEIEIIFYDQNYNFLPIIDSDMMILLNLKIN